MKLYSEFKEANWRERLHFLIDFHEKSARGEKKK